MMLYPYKCRDCGTCCTTMQPQIDVRCGQCQNRLLEFAEEWFQWQYKQDLLSDRFKAMTPFEREELLRKPRAKTLEQCTRQFDRISSRDVVLSEGWLDNRNEKTREAFTMLTGLELPSTNKNTAAFVRQWLGEDRVKAFEDAKQAEVERIEREKQEAFATKEKERIGKLVAKIREDSGIDGDSLVDVARSLGIDIHPRTIGMLRKRIVEIKSKTARIRGRGDSGKAFEIYRQVANALSSQAVAS